ncbi:hypothetical protein [Clavibacter sp.]|uniref:hypothetical protein n=1 Tax=Clavibacter sp. TaxID=1871044 RepID=UPI001999EB65|nr:hypothetical protein [Clavibacter sp.]MBD5381923.1 hypothetical protein [Clavibacter sp.]
MKAKYHIVTFSYDSGEDDKQDATTLSEAIKYAKEWMANEYYDRVYVYRNHAIVREYHRHGKRIVNVAK